MFDPQEAETRARWMSESASPDEMFPVDISCIFDPKSIEAASTGDVRIPIVLDGR